MLFTGQFLNEARALEKSVVMKTTVKVALELSISFTNIKSIQLCNKQHLFRVRLSILHSFFRGVERGEGHQSRGWETV